MEKINSVLKKGRHIIAILIMIAVSAAIIFFCANTYAEPLKAEHPSLSFIVIGISVFVCVAGILSYIFFVALKTDRIKTFMLFLLIVSGLTSIILPPNIVPDELSHYKTAYAYSNVIMGVNKNPRDEVLLVRSCDWRNRSKELSVQKYIKTFNNIEIFTDETELIEVDSSFVYTSPFYVYIPQTIGITLGRLLHLGGMVTYYLARFLNFIFYIIAFYFALKILPFGKTAFAVIGIFPIAVQQSISASSDVFINAVSFLVLANALKMIYSKEKIQTSQIVAFLILSVLLAPCKLIYFTLPFMALLIPKEKLPSKPLRIATKCLIPIASFITMVIVEFSNIANHMAKETGGTYMSDTPTYSIHYIFTDTKDFILLVLRTLKEYFSFYLNTTISGSLGSVQISTSSVLVVIFCVLLVLALIPVSKKTDNFRVTEADKLLSALIFTGTAGLVVLSMFGSWTPNNFDLIIGVQGRYFLPLLPLLIPIAYTNKLKASSDISRYVLFMAVCTNLYTMLSAVCAVVSIE